MLFPEEKIIFEIPIYSMSKKEFNKRWDKRKTEWIEDSVRIGNSVEKAKEIIYVCYYPQYIWKYNQIVGFVEISIGLRDVVLNVQKTLDTRMVAVSKTKHFIQDLRTNGMHFPISGLHNVEIVSEIDDLLKGIQKDLPGKMCLYLDTYNRIKNHIDFMGIHADIIKSEKARNGV